MFNDLAFLYALLRFLICLLIAVVIQGGSEGRIRKVLFGMHSVDTVIIRFVRFSAKMLKVLRLKVYVLILTRTREFGTLVLEASTRSQRACASMQSPRRGQCTLMTKRICDIDIDITLTNTITKYNVMCQIYYTMVDHQCGRKSLVKLTYRTPWPICFRIF